MNGIDLYNSFIETHKPQLEFSGVPKLYWPILYKKLSDQIFDSGTVFQLIKIDYEDTETEPTDPLWKLFALSNIVVENPNNIYLIDHAWMYEAQNARHHLTQMPQLLDRMCNIMSIDNNKDQNEKIDNVLTEMWRYNQCFSVNTGSIENRMPLWYIMDEVGSAINHSDGPNCRTVPFLYTSDHSTYTLLFPIRNIKPEEEITRDFVEGQAINTEKRKALLLPWSNSSFINDNFEQIEPDEDYFLAGRINETLPVSTVNLPFTINVHSKLKVFSQYKYLNEYLTDSAFEIVDDEADADILWLTEHFKDYKHLSLEYPNTFINQFPFENVLTVKDILCIVCRRAAKKLYDQDTLETYPVWLPATFNLNTELIQFVAFFEQRQSKNLDNYWICKPWNLARGLDTYITNNLYQILRLPSTGPKIAQRYISNPVLFDRVDVGRVKFDIRYVILLRSVKPLKLYIYSNFFLRFANKKFALNNFDVYEQHFTVMNYSDAPLCHLKCHEFMLEWEKQYPDHDWQKTLEPKICQMFREVFEAAVAKDPPKGIADSIQSRAVYAADLMLEWKNGEMQPVLLEVNFSPDCERACIYYPDFYNDIFKCLFSNIDNSATIREI